MAKILRCYNCKKEVATVFSGTGGKGCAIFCESCILLVKDALDSLNRESDFLNREVESGCKEVDDLMNLFGMKK